MRHIRPSALAPALVALVACSQAGDGGSPVELTVYAAASLRDALAEIRTTYESTHPSIALTLSTDSSATLRTQIEQGAPADVFLSADLLNPQTIVAAGLADGETVAFAGNILTIIVPATNPGGVASPGDLAWPGTKIVAAGDEVPITKYATQAVTSLAAIPGYPPDFAERYAANIVSKEENVRAVVAKIELGEGDAAIVYATDAGAAADVDVVEIPRVANVPATYAGVVVKASGQLAEAHSFLAWLAGPEGVAVLARFGFLPPP